MGKKRSTYPGVYEVKDSQGNIVKGKYLLKITQTINGVVRRDTRTVEATTQKKAYEQLVQIKAELKAQYETGRTVKNKMTFEKLADTWRQVTEKDYSPTTFPEYIKLLDNHILPYFGLIDIKTISKGTIYEYIDYKKRNTGLSDKSIRNQVMLVSTILTFAEEREYIAANPCLRLKLKKDDTKIKPKYFTVQQMQNMIKLADKMVGDKIKSFDNSINYGRLSDDEREKREHIRLLEILAKRLFINLCITCGSRRGEVIALKWSDIDFGEYANIEFKGTAYTVVGQGSKIKSNLKNGEDTKVVYLNDNLIPMLKEYKTLQNKVIKEQGWKNQGYIFLVYRQGRTGAAGQLARPNTYTHWFKVWLEKNKEGIGLTDTEVEFNHVHTMRHSYVSYNLNSGTSLAVTAELAGHKDKTVTANTYGHGYNEAKIEAAKLFNKLYDENN